MTEQKQKGRPLELGDRVAVYGWFDEIDGQNRFALGSSAKITAIISQVSGELTIQFEEGGREIGTVHRKQCRRLVPARPKMTCKLRLGECGWELEEPPRPWGAVRNGDVYEFAEVRPKR